MIKAVIFDLDGVLVEAKDWHYECLNRALALFGCDIAYEDHLTKFDGIPTKEKLKILNKENNFPLELQEIVYKFKQIYTQENFAMKCLPSFSQEYLMQKLKQNNIKIAVASNSIRATVALAMENLHLNEYIEFYLSNEDVSKGKPDPEIYIKAIDMLSLGADECLVVEDNYNGIKAAQDAGAHLLRVDEVDDVNHLNVMNRIIEINELR